jgi:hypothetical protein
MLRFANFVSHRQRVSSITLSDRESNQFGEFRHKQKRFSRNSRDDQMLQEAFDIGSERESNRTVINYIDNK